MGTHSPPAYLRQPVFQSRKALAQATPTGASVDYAAHLFILDKKLQCVHFEPNRVQRHYREHRTRRNLILKARQLGISTVIQADSFVTAISQTTLTATLAHDDKTTQKLRRMAARFYDNFDIELRPARGLDNATTTTYPQTHSEVTIVPAGSGDAGRGGTYSRLHGSEVAFWKDPESIAAGIMQGVTQDGTIELESSPNGAQGWFYERCMEALDPATNSEWTLHFYPWWWDDTDYHLPLEPDEDLAPYRDDELALIAKHGLTPEQIKFRRSKQLQLGRLFPQEYAEDPVACFLTSGAGVFGDISAALYTPEETPIAGHHYVGGVDWGVESDFTVLSIWDADAVREVFLLRLNRMRWGDMRRRMVDECRHWGVELLYVERNSASSNLEDLSDEMASADLPLSVQGFTMTNKRKASMVVNFHHGLHEDGVQVIDEVIANGELRSFVATQTSTGVWTYAAEGSGHDDTVIARMAGYTACYQRIDPEMIIRA